MEGAVLSQEQLKRRGFLSALAAAPILGSLTRPLWAQQAPAEMPVFTTGIRRVVVPTVVVNKRDKSYVLNLKREDFRILDNNFMQENVEEDVTSIPLSLVMVIQQSADMEPFLPNIRRVGSLIEQLLLGTDGEAAVVSFDSRVKTLSDFTTDSTQLKEALKKLAPGTGYKHQIDAMSQAAKMLKSRSGDRRRVIVLISEEKDKGSEIGRRDVLHDLEFNNIMVYALNISQVVRTWDAKPSANRGPYLPPGAGLNVGGQTATPSERQGFGLDPSYGNAVPILKQVVESVKDIFVKSDTELFTSFTGGRSYGFKNLNELERRLVDLQNELQSQYLLSFQPNKQAMETGGYHTLQVVVNRADCEVRNRVGYWAAAKFEQTEPPQK